MAKTSLAELSAVFAALADPTRLAIVERLSSGDATVLELAEPFALTQQAISKHLKVLQGAQLISRSSVGKSRPCSLDVDRMEAAMSWIDQHRQVWTERHDRLAVHLKETQKKGKAT